MALEESHHARMARYRVLDSEVEAAFLYLPTELSVLVLEVGTDIGFRMLFKGLDLIEEVRPLLVFHGNRGVTTAVYHPNSIPIYLSTVRHEPLEFGLRNTVPCHHVIQIHPKYHLSRLHIANRNGHDLTISGIIDMANHSGPMLNMLDVIKRDPHVLQISSGLHLIDQVHPKSKPHLEHVENKYLVQFRASSRELILLHVGLMAIASEHGNAIHDPKSSNIPERGNVILNAWGAHVFALLENRN